MNELDAMRLLGEANPVQAQDLAPLDTPEGFRRRVRKRRLVAAIAITALAAAALIGVFAFNRSGSGVHRHHLGNLGQAEGPIHRATGGAIPTGMVGPSGAQGAIGPTGSTGTSGPTGSVGPGNEGPGFSLGFLHRSDGTLKSFGVSVWEFQKTGFQIEVRYLGPRGHYVQGGYPVVYRKTVPAASMSPTSGSVGVGPSGRTGPGPIAWTWSGRFTPSEWNGGCRSGDYEIDLDYGAAGPFSNDASSDSFRCTGN